jgi:uncharacterized protein involved in outer membrane biogenesis
MRLWSKLLIGAVALVLVLVAGAALFITQVDPNEYRGTVADAVEGATGRKLRIGGDLRIRLLPVPSLEAHDVSFANAAWASQPDMVRVERLRADLALLPLLQGRIEIRRFEAVAPAVLLETNADGKANWDFSAEAAPDAAITSDAPSDSLAIVVIKLSVENAAVVYLDGKTGSKMVLDVSELTAGTKRAGGRVTISLRAAYQGLPITVDAKLGAAGAIAQNKPIEIEVAGTLGDAAFRVEGSVGKPLDAGDMRLDVSVNSPSTKSITDVAGAEIEELGPVDMQLKLVEEDGYLHLDSVQLSARPRGTDARVSGSVKNIARDHLTGSSDATATGKAVTVDLQGVIGESRFSINGEVSDPINARGLRLDVAADAKSTRLLTGLAGIEFEEFGPLKLTLTLLEQGGRFDLDDIKLTARPRNTDASMGGSIKSLALNGDGAKSGDKPAKVNVKGAIGDANYTVSGDVARPMQGKGLRLKVTLDTKSTRALTDLAGIQVEDVGPLDLKLTVIEKNNRFDLDSIHMQGRPRDARLTVKGSIQDVVNGPRPDLDIVVSANTLRQLDKSLPEAGPIRVSAKVRPSGKVIEVSELVAQVGKSDLSGTATVDTGGERLFADAKLRAKLIDLTEFAPPDDKSDGAATAQKPADGKIFSDNPLPLDALKKIDGNVEFAVERLITRKLTFENVDIAAKLDNGNLTVKPAFKVAGGTVDGIINITSRTQPAKLTADVNAQKVSIGALTKEIRGYETSKGLDSNLKMKLSGQGDSVRALMGGLGGDIRLDVGEGRLNNDVLDRVGADLFSQVIGVAIPTDEKDKTTAFKCGVVRFALANGDAIADETLVMETDKVLLQGSGLIDLTTEELDLGAKLAARKGIRIGAGTLSSLVRVQGTLAKPQLGTDLKGLVTTGARVGIAVATVGLSLLAESVYGRVIEDEHPCQTALAREIKATPADYRTKSKSKKN